LENLEKLRLGKFDLIYSRECYPFTRNNNLKDLSRNLIILIKNINGNGVIILENYSPNGVNLLYKDLKLINTNNILLKKLIKFPNKLLFLLDIINNKVIYLLISKFIGFIYFFINKSPSYYVLIEKK
jgi:hypothetical protein